MTVFITIPWFLPAYKAGGPIQSIANLIANYKIDIAYKIYTSTRDLDGLKLEGIAENTWVKYNDWAEVFYASNTNKKILKNEIALAKPDVLFIIGIFSWHYNILPMLLPFKNKKILSVRGMLHPGALSQKSMKKSIFLRLLNWIKIKDKVIFHATDLDEVMHIQNVFGNNCKIITASNFGKIINRESDVFKEVGTLKMITVALISPMKNHLLVLQSLVNCKANIEYTICGPVKDKVYWQQCLGVISEMPANIKVNYIGEINPNMVEKELTKNHVFIMPSKSENFGHAISEALSAKTPVITSHFTPWNNLEHAMAGINVDLNIDSILKAINFFASLNQSEYVQFSSGAYLYFCEKNVVSVKQEAYKILFS